VKLSAKGDYVWGRTLMAPKYVYLQFMAIGPDGTTAVGGHGQTSVTFAGEGVASQTFPVPVEFSDLVGAVDYDGKLRFLTVTDHQAVLPPRLAVAADGSVVYGGRFQEDIDVEPGPNTTKLVCRGTADGFLVRLDRAGKYLWSRQIGGPDLEGDPTPFIAPDGSLYATGGFGYDVVFDPSDPQRPIPQGGYDHYVMKLGLDNSYRWTRIVSGGWVHWIDFMSDGNLLLTGSFASTVDLDAGPGQFVLKKSSPKQSDLFLASWAPDGLFRWGLAFGGRGDVSPVRGVVRDDGAIVVGGVGDGAVDYDPGPTLDVHSADGFLTRFRR
jgi:hypothetical protein